MAAVEVEESGNGRKRKRRIERRLVVNEKVEVRSFEDGFLGSWHCGTVTACSHGVRHVKYDHLLHNDGSDFLVDVVAVSAVLDDTNSSISNSYSRGYIRPIPPKIDFGKWCLPYGLCVDIYYQDAWWEGVIFDHEDGLEERRIFFPDLGDELKMGIDTLRITQDWDEATGNWQRRGTWPFLEFIDQCEQEYYLAVSLKQIWYEVRAKKDFMKIVEWTSGMNDLWKELVMEVIAENLSITLNEMLRVFEIPSSVAVQPAEAHVDTNANLQVNLVDSDAIATTGGSVKCDMMIGDGLNQEHAFDSHGLDTKLPDDGPSAVVCLAQEKSQKDDESDRKTSNCTRLSSNDAAFPVPSKALSTPVSKCESFSGATNSTHQQLPIDKHKNVNYYHDWQPLSAMILTEAAFCPAAVAKYSILGKKSSDSLTRDVRKHLLYLGWKIECRQDKSIFRYGSPDGKYLYSLRQVCKHLMEASGEIPPSISKTEMIGLQDSCDEIVSSQVLEQSERSSCPEQWFQTSNNGSDVVTERSEFFHRNVGEYCHSNQLNKKSLKKNPEMLSKVRSSHSDKINVRRRQLLALGWHLALRNDGTKERWFYTSPQGRICYSLSTACNVALDENAVNVSKDSGVRHMESIYLINAEGQLIKNKPYSSQRNKDVQECLVPSNSVDNFSGDFPSTSASEGLVEISTNNFQKVKKLGSVGNLICFSPHLLQNQDKLNGKGYESGILSVGKRYRCMRSLSAMKQKLNGGHVSLDTSKFADDMKCSESRRVLRSSKRVNKVVTPSPSHNNPKTVLSWLIDNNVVLPRAKVFYCSRKGLQPRAEGRISRDGIKCCCCQKLFTLKGFEIHAGSTSSRSAASIYLEDGRSLLDCQILCNKKLRNCKREAFDCSKSGSSESENDYICSICHFGGVLILCDQCPSSFHQSCLGLKDIPEGDWFCRSCCCRICGQNKLKEGTDIVDGLFLTCHQCELKYHVECLGNKRIPHSGSYPKTHWFCSKHCEEIHHGLQKLLGKSIPLGRDNLTWMLLKATNSDTHYFKPPNVETLTENNSKLNVALSVMHECFEPVKEPHTRRDLVEDVIFSRRSELKRLDFKGFYTVLLERNDELISVASIRVYGEKVAEIPLVGTRFQYRRLGMCRILMNELEKRLRELGVQRLVLPAVSSVLNTWTTSFGFAKMTASERLEFLDYTFLDFQETIMCQKLLLKNAVVSSSSSGKSKRLDDVSKTSIDESSAMTEVHQTAQTEESGIAGQRQVEISAGNNCNNSPGAEVSMALSTDHHQRNSSHINNFPVCLAEGYKNFEGLPESADDYLKCYKRRRKLISC